MTDAQLHSTLHLDPAFTFMPSCKRNKKENSVTMQQTHFHIHVWCFGHNAAHPPGLSSTPASFTISLTMLTLNANNVHQLCCFPLIIALLSPPDPPSVFNVGSKTGLMLSWKRQHHVFLPTSHQTVHLVKIKASYAGAPGCVGLQVGASVSVSE